VGKGQLCRNEIRPLVKSGFIRLRFTGWESLRKTQPTRRGTAFSRVTPTRARTRLQDTERFTLGPFVWRS
jgi:hypothetical protein